MDQGMNNKAPILNRHLGTRRQQRGITKQEFNALLDAADRLVSVGHGCVAMTLSRHAAAALQAEGTAVGSLERVRRRAVVIAGDGTPITVLIPTGRRGRRYRHGQTGWSRA